MEGALVGFARVEGVTEGGEEGQGVGWRGEEEGDNTVVAEGGDDGGEEVGLDAVSR